MPARTDAMRRFNRYYAQRIGVLEGSYLGRRLPLAEDRGLAAVVGSASS